MASRVSQMRNGMQPYPQTQQHLQEQQLNESIERTRALMQQIYNSANPQVALAQMLQSNPFTGQIANMLHNGGNLEQIARNLAQAKGADINEVIAGLQKPF